MRIIFILFLLSGFSSKAQDIKVGLYLDTLCSPYMAGRAYVDSGHNRAAEFIAQAFKEIGLSPIKDSYFQKFSIDVNTFPGELTIKMKGRDFEEGKDFVPKPFSGSGKKSRKIVRLDTLIFSDSTAAKNFLKLKLNNKVLVYSKDDYSKLTEFPYEYIEKAFSSIATIELKEKLTASFSQKQYSGVSLEMLDSQFDDEAKRLKYEVQAEFRENLITQNVIGILPSKNKSDQYILITAHYDHLGKMDQAYFTGANDNASGIAMILDLARNFVESGNDLSYNLMFVAFGAEEVGLLGSEYFVKNPPVSLNNIRFVLNLDLMGNGEKGITVVNGKVFEKEMAVLDSINSAHNYLPLVKKRGKAANSDHYHFSERAVPAFFIYTMGGKPWYHDIYDRPEELTLAKYNELIALFKDFFKMLD
ncbi:MAG: M28 family metallopeptidase [Cytophagales bacterium]